MGRSFLIGLQWVGILAMSPLSEAHITKLFAHSLSCFFTLLGVFGRTEVLNFNEIQFFNILFCGQCSVLGDIIFGYLMVMKIFSWKLHCFPFHIWAHDPSGKGFCMQHRRETRYPGCLFLPPGPAGGVLLWVFVVNQVTPRCGSIPGFSLSLH